MFTETPPLPKPRSDVFTSIYRVFVLLLLCGIALILAFNVFHKTALTPECEAAIKKANTLISLQSTAIQGLSADYEKAVYNNPNVDNINKQILMANEYEFNALQMITLQNASLLEITTTCH